MYLIVEHSEGGTYVYTESDSTYKHLKNSDDRLGLNFRSADSLENNCRLEERDIFALYLPDMGIHSEISVNNIVTRGAVR